jgi:hypothetical protein
LTAIKILQFIFNDKILDYSMDIILSLNNLFNPMLTWVLIYIDPGTGSIILQALIGAVAGLAIAAKLYWSRVLKFFGIKQKSIEELDED